MLRNCCHGSTCLTWRKNESRTCHWHVFTVTVADRICIIAFCGFLKAGFHDHPDLSRWSLWRLYGNQALWYQGRSAPWDTKIVRKVGINMENRKRERRDCSFIFQALSTRIVLKLWVFKYTRHSDLVGYTLDHFLNLVARVFRRPTPEGAREERPWFRLVTCLPKCGRWQEHNGLEV